MYTTVTISYNVALSDHPRTLKGYASTCLSVGTKDLIDKEATLLRNIAKLSGLLGEAYAQACRLFKVPEPEWQAPFILLNKEFTDLSSAWDTTAGGFGEKDAVFIALDYPPHSSLAQVSYPKTLKLEDLILYAVLKKRTCYLPQVYTADPYLTSPAEKQRAWEFMHSLARLDVKNLSPQFTISVDGPNAEVDKAFRALVKECGISVFSVRPTLVQLMRT